MDDTDEILLGNKDGLHLLNDRLVDKDGSEYFIKDMTQASMKEDGSLRADGLLIDFKNGKSKVFYLTSTSTPLKERMKRGMIASFTMGGRGVMMTATVTFKHRWLSGLTKSTLSSMHSILSESSA